MRAPSRSVTVRVLSFVAVAAAIGCGAVSKTDGGTSSSSGGDGGSSSTAEGGSSTNADGAVGVAVDGSLPTLPDGGPFCSGDTPRLLINGKDAQVLMTHGTAYALNCCDSAEVGIATGMFQSLMYLYWRSPAGGMPGMIDLGSPPMGFGMELALGCDPGSMSCDGASEERYTTGFKGTLTYTNGAMGTTTSYCVSVAEDPAMPHTVIHSLSLYAPNIQAMF
jgi:hypothetical protein